MSPEERLQKLEDFYNLVINNAKFPEMNADNLIVAAKCILSARDALTYKPEPPSAEEEVVEA